MNYAEIILAGRVGDKPIIRASASGDLTAIVKLGCKPFGDSGGKTEWFTVVIKGKSAESIERHVKKGAPLFVQGTPYFHHWKDEDQQDRKTMRVKARVWLFTESKNSSMAKQAVADALPFDRHFGEGLDLK